MAGILVEPYSTVNMERLDEKEVYAIYVNRTCKKTAGLMSGCFQTAYGLRG